MVQVNTQVPTLDRAWAAGFFDGEGCISFTRTRNRPTGNKTWRPRIAVAQAKDGEAMLSKLRTCLGGLGRINYKKPSKPEHSPCWVLEITGFGQVQTAIGFIWPYLSGVKKAQFRRVLEACVNNQRKVEVFQ